MKRSLSIACFGSSLLSSYWNGAATYYRGIFKELARLGHAVTFYEPDAYDRQQHRDIYGVTGVRSVVYTPVKEELDSVFERVWEYDVIIKCSGIGVLDDYLEDFLPRIAHEDQQVIFWDVDAPATLKELTTNRKEALLRMLPYYDAVLTYGGGDRVVKDYISLGAVRCMPVYNAVDPETHFPTEPRTEYRCDLFFMGNRLPDRESRVALFFTQAAELLPHRRFLLGGSGWENCDMPPNVEKLGHVYTDHHNVLNSSARAVLNISRDDMAAYGYSPATRVFEAAAAGACIISDEWEGIGRFFEPDQEILVARDGWDVALMLSALTEQKARQLGEEARRKVLNSHCYRDRALQVENFLLDNSRILKTRN